MQRHFFRLSSVTRELQTVGRQRDGDIAGNKQSLVVSLRTGHVTTCLLACHLIHTRLRFEEQDK